MVSAMVRRAVMVVAAPALVAGASAAPAMASAKYDDDHKYKTVAVKVCKVVHDDDYDKYKDDKYKGDKGKDKNKGNKKFTIHIKTDYDYDKVKLRDGECEKVYLDYKYPKFQVTEDYKKGYELKYIKGYDGAYGYGDDGKFKFYKGDKYVKVVVHNEKEDKDYDYKH